MSNQYLMKIYPAGRGRDVYRNIEICGNSTLNQLCHVILEAFDFTDEHLYEFCMDNRIVKLHFIPNLNFKLILKIFLCFFTFILSFHQIIPKNCVYKRTDCFIKK